MVISHALRGRISSSRTMQSSVLAAGHKITHLFAYFHENGQLTERVQRNRCCRTGAILRRIGRRPDDLKVHNIVGSG